MQTCGSNGQWGPPVTCGPRQTCTGTVGSARCTCHVDPVCSSVGNVCATVSTLAVCMSDQQACLYQSSSSPCSNGACNGSAGAASCCTNACTAGATQCQSGTSLQTCAATSGCTAFSASTCAMGLVCERHAPAACVDPNWAEWPMPNGPTEVNAESTHDNGDGTVTDNVTGLMWQLAPGTDTFIWSAARTHCSQLPLAGHTDWRLPTLIELVSLLDFSVSFPAVNAIFSSTLTGGLYWSATPVSDQSNFAWEVNFNNGITNADATIGTNPVICVR
jgi:Protein of unknown function (DUF1566)